LPTSDAHIPTSDTSRAARPGTDPRILPNRSLPRACTSGSTLPCRRYDSATADPEPHWIQYNSGRIRYYTRRRRKP